jgi:hypothetical protein
MPLENFFCRLGRGNLGQRFAALFVLTEHIARLCQRPVTRTTLTPTSLCK